MRLREFYNNRCLFITGVTGFIGKVFLVKLMLSLPNVRKVFILLRPKKGASPSQRFAALMNQEPFLSVLNNMNNDDVASDGKQKFLEKFEVVEGDMQKYNLGLDDKARDKLVSQVEILFNIAASVQFDAPIKANMRDNYLGSKHLLELCMQMPQLISLVHVSTFFTNCHLKHIKEEILPLDTNCDQLADIISWLPEETLKQSDLLYKKVLENRPNAYITTKAMAENLISTYENKLPIAVVRPSIVVPSVEDPYPGWVDSINGPMGLSALASIGILRYVDWNYYAHADVVPVDSCANIMFAAAERTVRINKLQNTMKIKVYNLTTGTECPQTWGDVFEQLRAATIKDPPLKMLRVPIMPPRIHRANWFVEKISRMSEILFAHFIDLLLVMFGQKRILVRITAKLHNAFTILTPFMTTSYTSDVDNFKAAFDELDSDDKKTFPFDMKAINWPKYYEDAYVGGRKLILREDPSNIPAARTKFRILNVVEYIFNALLVFYSLYLTSKLLTTLVYTN